MQYSNLPSNVQQLGYETNSTFFNILANLAPQDLVFAFDFNQVGDSHLDLGGLDPLLEPAIVWSEQQPYDYAVQHIFPLFHMSVCGVDIFSNYSSHWDTLVDTGAVCLSLPPELFASLMRWIPSECVTDPKTFVIECFVPSGLPSDYELPWIDFRLSEVGSKLYLRLNDLLITTGDGRKKYCILETRQREGEQLPAFISFGSMVVSSFYTAFNIDLFQVGFAMKGNVTQALNSLIPKGQSTCAKIAICKGYQSYYGPSNSCLPPPCADYYFFMLDEKTMSCHFNPSIMWFFFVLLISLISAEIGVFYYYEYAGYRLTNGFDESEAGTCVNYMWKKVKSSSSHSFR
jgi:hypothetical protein